MKSGLISSQDNNQVISIPRTQNLSYHKQKIQHISKTGGATSPNAAQSQPRIYLSGSNIQGHKKTNSTFVDPRSMKVRPAYAN